jgi:putative DNA primase/helicase
MLSEGQIAIRPFGKNTETITVNCRAMTTLVNGNNIKIVGELIRRALTCRLNTKMERPETKKYNGKGPSAPVALIMRDRAKYITAIFNIVRAYRASGTTVNVEPLNGYEAWSELVQKPLVWAGIVDPVTSQKDARERDPERSSLRQRVLMIKKHLYDKNSFTANDVSTKMLQPDGRCQDLLDAFSRDGKPLNTLSIGHQLARDEDRVVDGFSIQLARATSGHSKGYCVMPRPTKEEPL